MCVSNRKPVRLGSKSQRVNPLAILVRTSTITLMQIQQRQLKQHLSQELQPAYLIHGDEPLLMQETLDAILKAAKKAGVTERQRLNIEPGFSWQQLINEAQALSLFSDKIIIHIHNPDAKFDDKASKALARYFEIKPEDKLLVITCCRIPNNRQTTKWFKALNTNGVTIPIWPVNRQQLPQFLQERCKTAKLQIDQEALQLLAKLTEGNLLAADQTITKLSLLNPDGTIDANLVARMMSDCAKFSVFDLANSVFNGDGAQATRILLSLKQAATEVVLVLWALQRDLAAIIALKQSPKPPANFRNPQLELQQTAARRLNANQLKAAVKLASQTDLIIKGLATGDAWDSLYQLAVLLAGTKLSLEQA